MAIKIKWQVKPPTQGSDEDKPQMFPRIADSEVVDTERLAELVAKRSSISTGAVVEILTDLPQVLAELLRDGKTIDISKLGSFKLSIGTDAQITPESKRRMRSVDVRGVNFQPDKELMEAIGKPKFQWSAGTGVVIAPTVSELIPQLEEYFKTHDCITRKVFEQTFGLKRATANYRLKELIDEGVIKSVGSGRDTVYKKGNA